MSRRSVLVAICSASLPPLPAGAAGRAVRTGDLLQAVDARGGTPLHASDLMDGGPAVLAWPMDPVTRRPRNGARFDQVLVFRSGPAVSVFTAVCTHAGCIVSDWDQAAGTALCPCHGSEYNLTRGGTVARGPAPLPLPRLPVRTDENGLLMVAGGFDVPVGGHTGRTD